MRARSLLFLMLTNNPCTGTDTVLGIIHMGMGGIWELQDGKIWEWDLSFRCERNGNGNEVIEMGGNWYA